MKASFVAFGTLRCFSEAEFVQPERENRFDFFYEEDWSDFFDHGDFLHSYMDASQGIKALNGAANRVKV